MTYIKIYEDETVSASIFALQKDSSLPVHDHPHMYGFIKCIYGTLKITSYSQTTKKSSESIIQKGDADRGSLNTYAYKESDLCVTESCQDIAILTPKKGNIHSISAVDGPAAFIDFLIPPYGDKDCHYFAITDATDDIHTLQQIPCPSWYWCAHAPYRGSLI